MPKTSTSFKPGNNANPNGRPPKGYSITEMMKEMLAAEPDLKKTIGKVIAKKALEGDITAIKTLWGYMDGAPPQNLNIGGQEGNEIKIVIEDYGSKDNSTAKTATGAKNQRD